ncbi:response regulator [Frigidibacter sp. MR17.14]|uniref:response regulator n=1 Tax=Frigidibacter sp. MR17.14 TaxID=3126509 RepID=UPI003012F188
MSGSDGDRVLRALVLDDQPVDILRLRRLCARAGLEMQIDEAGDLEEFRDRLDEATYDVCFLDHHLGAATGLDALAVLTAHPDQAETLAIMITSVTDHRVAVEAMRLGCADYLVKEELTESALRKSLAQATERRILLAAISRSQMFRATLERRVKRFATSCGPEMRAVLSSLRREIVSVKRNEDLDPGLRVALTMVEAGARDITVLLDDVATLAIEAGATLPAARAATRGAGHDHAPM